ncbi:hypothetical protein [Aureimonas pseudogalii]|uniref:Uncharacterized protein n=1 Tax=Aureimonas pseudogalii TaxID=1744844 RepID=A0A7W6EFB0_9HYPH|nr:hypothetical protein [Aureimonas pseudogalii]MBB3997198.1 hypothetical protein [Aureimonas pseudogalii]
MQRTEFRDVAQFGMDPFGGEGEILSRETDHIVWIRNNGDGSYTTCNQSLVDPILEANAEKRSETAGKRWGDGQIVASIPNALLYGDGYYAQARAAGDKPAMKKFLNDSDYAKLRTKEGRI